MAIALRRSGIEVIGDIPWGTHFCQFYDTKEDLLEILVPYFKAGLEDNEVCVWVVSELTAQEAEDALKQAAFLPELERYLADGSIKIISVHDVHLNGGALDLSRAKARLSERLAQTLASGYAGMRVTGSALLLEKRDWRECNAYEEELNNSIVNLPIICLCSYPLAACGAAEILDVARTHQFTAARRNGKWEVVETSQLKQAKSELKRLNDQLDQRVVERTRELTVVNQQLKRALDEIEKLRQRLESENAYLRQEVNAAAGDGAILGNSAGVRGVIERIGVVAATDAIVLILGETGAGKELVARAIHQRSGGQDRPMIKVNCGAIPRELFESEFFGHVKGAFTGAIKDRIGRFQLADGGTLFLDEVSELPMEMQSKLLRVLEDGKFEAVGDARTLHADVRVIVATNRDLKTEVRAGRFREDLYYRVSVFPIEVPPLRERKEDIRSLAKHFLELACRRFDRLDLQVNEEQLHQLQIYRWPGNVRELQNVVERAVIAARDGTLRFDIPENDELKAPAVASITPREEMVILDQEIKRRERVNIAAALKRSKGRIYGVGGAAELLGMRPTTLNARVTRLGLKQVR